MTDWNDLYEKFKNKQLGKDQLEIIKKGIADDYNSNPDLQKLVQGVGDFYQDLRTVEGEEKYNPLNYLTAGTLRAMEGAGWLADQTAGRFLKNTIHNTLRVDPSVAEIGSQGIQMFAAPKAITKGIGFVNKAIASPQAKNLAYKAGQSARRFKDKLGSVSTTAYDDAIGIFELPPQEFRELSKLAKQPGINSLTLARRYQLQKQALNKKYGNIKSDPQGALGPNPTDEEIFAEYKRLQDLTEKDFAAYREFQNPKDPRKIENELKARAIAKGEADPTGYRSVTKYGSGTVYENLSTANQKLFKKYGFTDDEAVFVMDNFQSMSRNFEAGIAGGRYSITDFNKATKDMMPAFLDEWANLGITTKKLRPQLDHIAQLAATIPAYANSKLKDFPKITQIFVKYGIFGGHDPRNFQYLPAEIHTLKTNYFNDLIGKDGMKFWSQHDLTTDAGIEKGIREYAALIANSHQIMLDAKKAYRALYKQDIQLDEMTDLLYQIVNPYQKYTLKEMKFAVREMLRRRVEDILKSNELLKRNLSNDESINQSMKALGMGTKKLPKLPSILSLQQAAIDNIYQPLLTDPTTGKPFEGFLYDIPKRNKRPTDKQIDKILDEYFDKYKYD